MPQSLAAPLAQSGSGATHAPLPIAPVSGAVPNVHVSQADDSPPVDGRLMQGGFSHALGQASPSASGNGGAQ